MSNKHMMMIEFTQLLASTDIPMVALYNETRISEEETSIAQIEKAIADKKAELENTKEKLFRIQSENETFADEILSLGMNGEFNNLETEFQIMRRARRLIDRLLEKYPGKIIIIVTHSHFLKACFKPYIQS